MKFVLAPDSFKECLRASRVCTELATGIHQVAPEAEIESIPLADGGEGSLEALEMLPGAERITGPVHGPLREAGRVDATFLLLPEQTGVIELAQASGLELLEPARRDAGRATTFGTGEQLRRAVLEYGARNITIMLGGSASSDGGAGLFQALGGRLYDEQNRLLPPGIGGAELIRVARIDLAQLPPELAEVKLRIAADVTNPLTGPPGAAAVFSPQKGATPEMVMELENNLRHWAHLWNDPGDAPGDGAAGGTAFLLRKLFGARPESGAERMLELTRFDQRASGGDCIITGEGRTDFQSIHGKLCSRVAAHAARLGIPVILVSGALAPGMAAAELFTAAFSIAAGPGTLADAITHTPENLQRIGRNLAALATTFRKHQ